MWTLGIDIAKHTHNASLLDDAGKVVFRNFSFANSRQGFNSLLEKLDATGHSPRAILVGMEATGHYWMILYQRLVEAGYTVHVINPTTTSFYICIDFALLISSFSCETGNRFSLICRRMRDASG